MDQAHVCACAQIRGHRCTHVHGESTHMHTRVHGSGMSVHTRAWIRHTRIVDTHASQMRTDQVHTHVHGLGKRVCTHTWKEVHTRIHTTLHTHMHADTHASGTRAHTGAWIMHTHTPTCTDQVQMCMAQAHLHTNTCRDQAHTCTHTCRDQAPAHPSCPPPPTLLPPHRHPPTPPNHSGGFRGTHTPLTVAPAGCSCRMTAEACWNLRGAAWQLG